MVMPFLLLAIGWVLILLEFYLPGGIIGVIGGGFIIASVISLASQTHSLWLLSLFIIGAAISIALLIRFALWRIVHAKPGYSIYLNEDQEGFQASQYDASVIGKKGVVLSDLKPGGYILIEGKQHQAISVSGYISKGSQIIVLSGQEESLIVQTIKEETKS